MSITADFIYKTLSLAGIGDTPWAKKQLKEACADMIGEKFNVEDFITNLQYRGEWHYTTQDKIRQVLRPLNGESVHFVPRKLLSDLIENAETRAAKAAQKAPERESEPPVWLTVYKDALGYPDDHDNLTEILVPEKWFMDFMKGTDLEEWFCEYTADETDALARQAVNDGVILDCSNPGIKAALLGNEKTKESALER